jgi:hypothetical protein
MQATNLKLLPIRNAIWLYQVLATLSMGELKLTLENIIIDFGHPIWGSFVKHRLPSIETIICHPKFVDDPTQNLWPLMWMNVFELLCCNKLGHRIHQVVEVLVAFHPNSHQATDLNNHHEM